ncbi:MAG: glycoside hydrolase family 5 protein [Bacteroidota bacterium]|nr:glycoside hydrolase family 5 protein [Bacteroidota bacterium]
MAKFFQKTQRVLWSLSLSLAATAFLASCEKTSDNVQPEPTVVAPVQNITAPENMRGVNVQLRDGTVDFNRIHAHNFNTVRIVIDVNDYHYTHFGIGMVGSLMRQANAAGLSVVLVYYNANFMYSDRYDANAMATASNFWVANLPYLQSVGVPFDLNIINEPCFKKGTVYQITGAQWRDEQNSAVGRIHARGFTGAIIIDAPGFAHETSYIRARGPEVAVGSPIIYSLHVYPDSFYNGALPTNSADDRGFMTDLRQHAGHRVIIGEFGEYGGGRFDRARVQAFVNSAQASSADCGAIAWAWNGDGSAGHMNADSRPDYLNWLQSVVPN